MYTISLPPTPLITKLRDIIPEYVYNQSDNKLCFVVNGFGGVKTILLPELTDNDPLFKLSTILVNGWDVTIHFRAENPNVIVGYTATGDSIGIGGLLYPIGLSFDTPRNSIWSVIDAGNEVTGP